MGFLFFGSPDEEFIINEIGEPCIVSESWDEEDFLVTVTAITFSENDEQYLYDITLIAENQELFSEKTEIWSYIVILMFSRIY